MYYTYLLKLENLEYYAGYTNDLKERISKHKSGSVVTTNRIKPLKLVFYAAFRAEKKAVEFEKYLKSSSRRAFRNKHLI